MDLIKIRGLLLRCVIGCNPEERRGLSDVVIDLDIAADVRAVGISDNPNDMWNYRTAAKAVIADVVDSQFLTIEALATRIARTLVVEGKAPWAMVRVTKPGALRFADSVGVEIRRSADDFAAVQEADAA